MQNCIWKIYIDGSTTKEGSGEGIVLIYPSGEITNFSYKLEFEATNNVVEYEALILGLKATRELKIENILVFGDSELVRKQIKEIYQTKHPRLWTYRNEVWDLIDNFFLAFNITTVARDDNQPANSLVIATSGFKIPTRQRLKYEIEVRYRPLVLDNIKHWKVFKDDE